MDKFKRTLSNAGKATSKAGHKAKLQVDLRSLKSKIASRKQQFGEDVFDSMAEGDEQNVQTILAAAKADIEKLEAEISAKETELAKLGEKPAPGETSTETSEVARVEESTALAREEEEALPNEELDAAPVEVAED